MKKIFALVVITMIVGLMACQHTAVIDSEPPNTIAPIETEGSIESSVKRYYDFINYMEAEDPQYQFTPENPNISFEDAALELVVMLLNNLMADAPYRTITIADYKDLVLTEITGADYLSGIQEGDNYWERYTENSRIFSADFEVAVKGYHWAIGTLDPREYYSQNYFSVINVLIVSEDNGTYYLCHRTMR